MDKTNDIQDIENIWHVKKISKWRFEFSEMVGGKTVVFVYHEKILKSYCRGPNAFFVVRK